MDRNRLRVFHGLVNYGTQAGVVSKYLRLNGVMSFSATFKDPFKRQIDFELLSGGNFFKRIAKHSINALFKLRWFFKFNIFHFYYGQTLFKNQRELPFYSYFGKKVIMHYLGNDVQKYHESVKKYKYTNMPGFMEDNDPVKYDEDLELRLKRETPYCQKQFVCAPMYSEFVHNSEVIPLAIDLTNFSYKPLQKRNVITIMHAPTHRGFKGSEYITSSIKNLIAKGYPIRLNLVEKVTHDQLKLEYEECDIFIDQVLAGWYGTASIEAMAIGRPVVCFLRDEYFKHIDYGHQIPIISANPDNLETILEDLIKNQETFEELGRKSRKFVEQIHDADKIAKNLIKVYEAL